MVIELKIRFQHTCPFLKLSELFDEGTLFSYCSRLYDVIRLPKRITPAQMRKANEFFPNVSEWRLSAGDYSQQQNITMPCKCGQIFYHTIADIIREGGGLPIYPVWYTGGWEYRKIICFNDKEVEDSINSVKNHVSILEVLSEDEIGEEGLFRSQTVFMSDIINDLTDHQLSLIVKAYDAGYYEIPRKVTIAELAQSEGVSRQAFEKNIRKAENKLIKAIIPFLYIRDDENASWGASIVADNE